MNLELGNKCRICLKDNVDIHWNNFINDCSNLTYKDCYYKYTQLECFDEDCFSQMLCHSCSDGLEYIDTFISKALDTHFVLDTNRISMLIKVEGDDLDHDSTEFEPILIEETKPEMETLPIIENFNKELPTITQNNKTSQRSKKSIGRLQKQKTKSVKYKKTTNKIEDLNNFEDEFIGQNITAKDLKTEVMEDSTSKLDDNENTKKFKSMCCSISSEVLYSKYTAIVHEKTHIQNRDRNETCDVCGLKFFNKCALKSHMKTHSEDREKHHKCEYCDKSFYYQGDLTRHRRKHLGQINWTCDVCGLKFLTKWVLKSHMKTHSEDREKPHKCESCDKGFYYKGDLKRHRRTHLGPMNETCDVCGLKFFNKWILRSHRKTHSEDREKPHKY